jgi:hypothetical protein
VLVIFLVLLLGPFAQLNPSRSTERWLLVKRSVAAVWQRSETSIAETMKPLLTATSPVGQAVRREPARIASRLEPPPVPDAPPDAIAAPGNGAAAPGKMECTEARAALSLCPQK